MDKITAFQRLINRAVASGDGGFLDELSALVDLPPQSPPRPGARLHGRSHELAEQIHKNGYEARWGTEAMQALTFRLVQVLEAFADLLPPAAGGQVAGARAPWWPVGGNGNLPTRLLPGGYEEGIALLGEIYRMTAYEQASPDSVAQLLLDQVAVWPDLARRIGQIDEREAGVVWDRTKRKSNGSTNYDDKESRNGTR